MSDVVKTLGEWMLDPTTRDGDQFEPSGENVLDKRRVIINGWKCLVKLEDDEDDLEFGEEPSIGHVSLDDFRRPWRRLPMDLRHLTVQEALDRGVVRLVEEPRCDRLIDAPYLSSGRAVCSKILPCPDHDRWCMGSLAFINGASVKCLAARPCPDHDRQNDKCMDYVTTQDGSSQVRCMIVRPCAIHDVGR